MSTRKYKPRLVDPNNLIGPQVALAPSTDSMLDKCLDSAIPVAGKKLVCFIGPPHPSEEIYSNRVLFANDRNQDSDIEEELDMPHDLVGHQGAQFDPWALPELTQDDGPKWKDLTYSQRVHRVLFTYILKVICLMGLLYLFICSLGILSSAFRLLGGRTAGKVFQDSQLLRNPITGLMIGVLATVLLQSSSTSTSIVVSMVASSIMDVKMAIPVIMGANIGTSMTNTLVSVAHSSQRAEFRRAFAGATVHDMFNWLCVLILLPMECATGYLFRLTDLIVKSMNLSTSKHTSPKLLKVFTDPFTKLIIQLDKKLIKAIALNQLGDDEDVSLIKRICSKTAKSSGWNDTLTIENSTELVFVTAAEPVKYCSHIFAKSGFSDTTVGLILLVASLVVLIGCLVFIVKLLHSMLKGQIATAIRKTINNDLPGVFSCLTGYLMIMVGAIMTILVQSSSVFTSALTPLVGIGVLSLERMYPLTLGANVGTTFTSMLAALSSDQIGSALQISLCHLFFNLSGILLFYVIPVTRKAPIGLAKLLGNKTAKYRWVAVVYVVISFFLLPAAIMGLSLAGTVVFVSVVTPIATLFATIVLINLVQSNWPKILPRILRNWEFLPEWMHSLAPLDRALTRVLNLCPFCITGWPCCSKVEEGKGSKRIRVSESRKFLLRSSPGASNPGSIPSRLASRSSSPSRLKTRDITNV